MASKYPYEPVFYSQTDAQWANIDYSAKGEKTTIGRSGCGPTCAAMVVSSWHTACTPIEACNWALQNGYKAVNQGTYYSFFKPFFAQYGITAYQLNGNSIYGVNNAAAKQAHETVRAAISNGDYVIACLGKSRWTSSGHFVLWYGYTDIVKTSGSYTRYVYLQDPNNKCNYATYSEFTSAVKYYFIIEQPENYSLPPAYTIYAKVNDNVSDGYLNLRSSPIYGDNIVGRAKAGEIIPCEEPSEGWARCEVDNKAAFFNTTNVTLQLTPDTGKWYDPYIQALTRAGIIHGDENGDFQPEKSATKAEVATMLYNTLKYIYGEDFKL